MTLQQLFELPPDVRQPHAYQLFGLTPGEQDGAVIEAAIQKRIAHVKAARPSLTPELWQQSVKLIQMARALLANPDQKAELDARFGIFATSTPSIAKPDNPPESDDPLAGLLPPAANRSVTTARSQNVLDVPAAPPSNPSVIQEAAPTFQAASNLSPVPTQPPIAPTAAPVAVAIPQVRSVRRTTRRRGSWMGCFLGLLLVSALIGMVGGLVYFAMLGPGRLEIVKQDGAITFRTGDNPPPNTPVAAAPSVQAAPPPPRDPILNAPPEEDGPAISLNGDPATMPQAENRVAPIPTDSPAMQPVGPMATTMPEMPDPVPEMPDTAPEMAEMPNPEMVAPTMNPAATIPAPNSDPPAMNPEPTTAPPTNPPPTSPPPATAEEIATAQTVIDNTLKAISAADFAVMKSLAENAQSLAKTPEQQMMADTLYEFADLATFYDEGITRAIASLKPLDEFMVNVNTPVIVQAITAQSVTVLLNKQDYTVPRNALPMSIAHGLAALQVPTDTPTGQAAKAAYQSIAPKANADHREEAIQALRGLQEVEGADPQKLADFIATLPPRP